jgi:unsaturated chondroitin disaccharide hydrolase
MKKTLATILLLVLFCQLFLTSCQFIDSLSGNDKNDDVGENDNTDKNDDTNKNEGNTNDSPTSTDVPDRFKVAYTIDREKLERAAEAATEKLYRLYEEGGVAFPATSSTNYQYTYGANNNWTAGMYTASYLMAYQLTGDQKYADIVNEMIDTFVYRVDNRVGMGDHDVGFAFMPSCIGAYKILGSGEAKAAALRAVEYYYDTSYSKEGKFIIRAFSWNSFEGFRTMMDSQMNASLLFWAGDYLNTKVYSKAALDHTMTTIDLLVRDDGSTYHHYQFDPDTAEPLYGVTWQGYADESCWSRGQSWGIYGFSIAHSYTESEEILNAQRDVTYYMLSHLPEDLVPYWDYTFTDGSDEPRDTSAAAIAVCGMLDMAQRLPEGSEQRLIYESAAAQIMEVLIDHYTGDIGVEYDGLINTVTHAKPQGHAIEECAPYADYFYLEALARYLKEDFIRPW